MLVFGPFVTSLPRYLGDPNGILSEYGVVTTSLPILFGD